MSNKNNGSRKVDDTERGLVNNAATAVKADELEKLKRAYELFSKLDSKKQDEFILLAERPPS